MVQQMGFGDEVQGFVSRLEDDLAELVGRPGSWVGVEAFGTGFDGVWA